MSGKVFVDTNILIYAYDMDVADKRDSALAVARALWEQESGVISTQVLQEFLRERHAAHPHALIACKGPRRIERVLGLAGINYSTRYHPATGTAPVVVLGRHDPQHRISRWSGGSTE